MTEKVPTDATRPTTRPTTRQAMTATVCPGLRSNCRATYFESMATVPGSRVAAANSPRADAFREGGKAFATEYAHRPERLTRRLRSTRLGELAIPDGHEGLYRSRECRGINGLGEIPIKARRHGALAILRMGAG